LSAQSIQNKLQQLETRAAALHSTMADPVLQEITRQMKAANIPTKSGDLERSLTQPGDVLQIYRETSDGVVFGSRARAAKYNPSAVPALDMTELTRVVGKAYSDGG